MPQKDDWGRICGFLFIDEEDKKKKFEERFFLLNKLHGHLEWYTDNPLTASGIVTLQGIINLDYITNVDEAKKLKQSYGFVINTIHQSYYVYASSQTDMEEWVKSINDASKIIVPPEALLTNPDSELYLNPQHGEDDFDAEDVSGTRTEIVGNVVVKKRLSENTKPSIDESSRRRNHSIDAVRGRTDANSERSSHMTMENGIDEKDIIKEGWLSKQNRNRKTFKQRYVVLLKDCFVYFKSDRMTKHPLHHVSINDIVGAKAEDDDDTIHLYDNIIIIITLQKIFYFQAEDRRKMREWVEAFNKTVLENKTYQRNVQVSRRSESSLSGTNDDFDGRESFELVSSAKKRDNKQLSSYQNAQQSFLQAGEISCSHSFDGSSGALTHLASNAPDSNFTSIGSTKFYVDNARSRIRSIEEVRETPKLDLSRSVSVFNDSRLMSSHRSSFENFVSGKDRQVDNRSALKPSLLKKKKTLGILFSFNTMLSKKRERIQKENAKYRSEQHSST